METDRGERERRKGKPYQKGKIKLKWHMLTVAIVLQSSAIVARWTETSVVSSVRTARALRQRVTTIGLLLAEAIARRAVALGKVGARLEVFV